MRLVWQLLTHGQENKKPFTNLLVMQQKPFSISSPLLKDNVGHRHLRKATWKL